MTLAKYNENINQSINGDNNFQAGGDLTLNVSIINKLPSLLAEVVPKLNDLIDQGKFGTCDISSREAYSIEDKINHNKLVAYKHWVDEYGEWGAAVDEAYDELDNSSPNAKAKIFRSFKGLYAHLKGEALAANALLKNSLSQIEVIREHADDIIAKVAQNIRVELSQAENSKISAQDLYPVSIALTCHAFINCKILERPLSNVS